jgi:hypothetical protein
MTTLALDLGSHCGFALLRPDGRIESGTENFSPGAKDTEGARWVKFRRWLIDTKATNERIDRIAYELVVAGVPGQVYAAQIYGGFVAILQSFCEHHQIAYSGINVSVIKKRWTGNGNAKKPLMIARCRELGFQPGDDNEADAIALLHVALDRVPALPLERQFKPRRLRKNPDTASRSLALDRDPF